MSNGEDVRTRLEAEVAARHVRELEVSERRFHSAFTHASIGMALVSFDGRVLQVNSALRALLGIDKIVPGVVMRFRKNARLQRTG